MSIKERNAKATIYIEKCKLRRQRKERSRRRKINRFVQSAVPFACGVCLFWFVMALI